MRMRILEKRDVPMRGCRWKKRCIVKRTNRESFDCCLNSGDVFFLVLHLKCHIWLTFIPFLLTTRATKCSFIIWKSIYIQPCMLCIRNVLSVGLSGNDVTIDNKNDETLRDRYCSKDLRDDRWIMHVVWVYTCNGISWGGRPSGSGTEKAYVCVRRNTRSDAGSVLRLFVAMHDVLSSC